MFFQVDDQFQVNPKARGLAERAITGDLSGLAAIGLWTMAGSLAQAALTDGVVSRVDLIRVTLNPAVAEELAHLMVAAGLWHAPGHGCDRCAPVEDGSWIYHDWFRMGYDSGAQVKVTREKRKELKDPALINAIWARDRLRKPAPGESEVAKCRYGCGKLVKRADRKGDFRWEPDHVDPTKAIGVRNVVVACVDCNRKKGNRTPEQAGMVLQPAPGRDGAAEAAADVSPGTPAAETSPATPSPAPASAVVPADERPERPARPGSLERITGDITGDRSPQNAVFVRGTRAGAGQAGSGQGKVPGEVSQGSVGSAPPDASRRPRRNRRRGRGRSGQQPLPSAQPQSAPQHQPAVTSQNALAPEHDAGAAPAVPTPGRFGSPWHGWSGPPSTVTETTCEAHRQEMPCRFCKTSDPA